MSEAQATTPSDGQIRRFLVTWQIDEFATSPREAARQAMQRQRDRDSTAVVFDVQEFTTVGELSPDVTQVDLFDFDGADDV